MSGETGKALTFGRMSIPRFTMDELQIVGPMVRIGGMLHATQASDGISAMDLRDMAVGYGRHNPDEDRKSVV